MVNKNVLVTGASGYLGSRLCSYLADQGYCVTALCHSKLPSSKSWNSKLKAVVLGDVRNEDFILELARNNFDIVVHLVSLDHHQSNSEKPSIVSSVNITPVWSMLDIFARKGIEKFIYFSTMQVYGPVLTEDVNENNEVNTQTPYGLTHHIGEVISDYYNRTSTVQCSSVRLSNSYGAPIFSDNNCWWLVINDLCKMAYMEKKIILQSDGSPLRDFIHGWDVCQAIEKIIATQENHSVYHICSGKTLSIMDIALKVQQIYEERYGITVPISAKPLVDQKKTDTYHLNNSLIKSIGFNSQWSMDKGIHELFDYLENNHQDLIS